MSENVYQSPQAELTDHFHPDQIPPGSIKVFGILDLVFGGLGIIQFLFGLVTTAVQRQLFEASAAGDDAMVNLQIGIAEKLKPFTYLTLVFSLVLIVLTLRAGLALVKNRKHAVKASNLYAYTSIGFKVVTLAVSLIFVVPIYNEMFEQVGDGALDQNMLNVMKMTAVGGMVGGAVVMAIYPVVCLIFLNKENVRSFLAKYGSCCLINRAHRKDIRCLSPLPHNWDTMASWFLGWFRGSFLAPGGAS